MINASVLLKNKMDKHLNVFWQYDGKPWLENNITKALINTFESLDEDGKREFVKEFFGIELSDKIITYEYYLQSSPKKEYIESCDEDNKLLFAFSPTGKAWGTDGIDSGNIHSIEENIKLSIIENYPSKDEKEISELVQKQVKETKKIIDNKGDSIPDAWILIFEDDKIKYCVAMENKLYDLDPFQLHNHCEKSLFMKQNHIRYVKYSDMLEVLNGLNGYLIGDFLRYMYFLGYWNVDNLIQLSDVDEDSIKGYAQERCRQLLIEISNKDVSKHRGWLDRYRTDNEFNREIGMEYLPEQKIFRMKLYFGSTQSSARALYYKLGKTGYQFDKRFYYCNSFHFQYIGIRKNVNGTYYSIDNFDIDKYIEFWVKNADSLWQMNHEKRAELLKKMLIGDIIPKDEYDRLLQFSEGYEKSLNVCPEFGVYCEWDFKQAQLLDEKGLFAKDIQDCINEIYNQFNILG